MERNKPFFKPGGTMDPSAPSYLERAADEQLLAALLAGEYVSVLDSRQKGKSSLIARTIVKLHTHGVQTIKLDLQRIGANVSAEQWYAGLLAGIGTELNLTEELFAFWESHRAVGPLARWISAISEVVLKKNSGQVVIFVDEVDFVRALSFPTDEFFAGIRDCYNRRSEAKGFERLTFCLVGVATPGQLIRNPEITPFNIGTKVELSDFTLSETAPFALALNNWGRNGELLNQRVHYWVNGHPYLTQLLCSHISVKPEIKATANVDALVKELFFTPESRHREPNFADVERRILDPDVPGMSPDERKTQVLDLYGRLLRGKGVEASEENPVVVSLRLAGVGNEDHGSLRVRNRVYKTVFDEGWRRQSLPNAELRRQRGAARLAILRTATVAGVLVLAISSAAVGILKISKEREKALITLGKTTKDLSKVSSDRKVALTDLEKRNLELKRISGEREEALASLGKSNEDLKLTSEQRQRALTELERQAIQLEAISNQRQTALGKLKATTEDLQAQNYVGLISSLYSAIAENRWPQATDLIEQTEQYQLRNWEWGHAALKLLGGLVAEAQLPSNAIFERQPDGRLWAISDDAIYEVTRQGVKFRRKMAGRPIWAGRRRGNLRIGQVQATLNEVIRDVNTDQIVAEISDLRYKLMDFDDRTKTILANPNIGFYGANPRSNPEISFEVRSLDGKKLLRQFIGPSALSANFLLDGTILCSDRTGMVTKYDRQGKQLAAAKLPRPGRLSIGLGGGQYFACVEGLDGGFEIRRQKDLGVHVTLSDEPQAATNFYFIQAKEWIVGYFKPATIRLYDAKTGSLVRSVIGQKTPVKDISYVDDLLVVLDIYGHIKYWDTSSTPSHESFKRANEPYKYSWFESDPNLLILVTKGGTWISRNLKTQKETICQDPDSKLDTTTSFGEHVYISRTNGKIDKLSLHDFHVEKSAQVFSRLVSRTWFSANGKRLVAEWGPLPYTNKTEYSIIDTDSMKEVSRFKYHWESRHRSTPDVSISADGTLLAVSTNEYNHSDRTNQRYGTVHLFSTTAGRVIGQIHRRDSIYDIELLPDGKSLIAASFTAAGFENEMTIYSTKSLRVIGNLPVPEMLSSILDLWVDPTGKFVVATSLGTSGLLWNIEARKLTSRLFNGFNVPAAAFSPDGKRLIVRADGMLPVMLDCKSGKELINFDTSGFGGGRQVGMDRLAHFSISPDGRDIVATGLDDGVVHIFHSLPWKNQPKTACK